MADSAVAVTAGTGTNIDTRTEGTNGNHRQVVVLGDPATNAGVAPVDATAGLKVDLGADNDVTVTGTVTANLSATDNAVLDNIDTATTAGTVLLGTIDADTGAIATSTAATAKSVEGDYETVAASQTAQVLGATGAAGDYISHVLVIPATTSPGNVLLLDNATSITIFTGGASSVTNLVPFAIPLNMISASGAWKITTGANVSVIGVGSFT